jgi:hypothetical protein
VKTKTAPGSELPLSQQTQRHKGRYITYISRGQLVTQAWTRGHQRPPTPAELEQQAEFKALVKATKEVMASDQVAAREIADGSKQTWRDILSRMMIARLVDYPNYGEIVSQYNLDILGRDPGMIVIRTPEQWIALPPGPASTVLTIVAGLPAWATAKGIVELIGDVLAGPGDGTQVATLAETGVVAGDYTLASISVDAKGRITAASDGSAIGGITELVGEVLAGPGSGSQIALLADTTVVPGSYTLANLTIDSAGRITAASDGSAAGSGTIPHPGFITGRYYTTQIDGTMVAATATVNTLYAVPFYVGELTTFDRLGCFVTVTAAGNLEMGVYENNAGIPGALIADSGSVAIPASNNRAQVTGMSIPLAAGWYWLAIAVSAPASLRSLPNNGSIQANILGLPQALTGTTSYRGMTASWTFSAGNLPDPFPSPTPTISPIPLTFIGL